MKMITITMIMNMIMIITIIKTVILIKRYH